MENMLKYIKFQRINCHYSSETVNSRRLLKTDHYSKNYNYLVVSLTQSYFASITVSPKVWNNCIEVVRRFGRSVREENRGFNERQLYKK